MILVGIMHYGKRGVVTLEKKFKLEGGKNKYTKPMLYYKRNI